MKNFGKILIIIGIVGMIFGIGLYQFKTKTVEVSRFTVTIDSMTYYTKRSWWNWTTYYHVEEQVTPAETTKPNTKYLLVIDFYSFKYENNVSWSQSEINLNTEKTVSNVISYDEYMTLTQQPQYILQLFEMKPQHNLIYIVPGILVLVLGTLIFLRSEDKKVWSSIAGSHEPFSEQTADTKTLNVGGIPYNSQKYENLLSEPTPEQRAHLTEAIHNKIVSDALETALGNMDTTHRWYTNEDEANRELVSCLKTMGYDALYHKYLDDGRTADAFFESSIIEAKLDPSQSEVDRLEGQITEYLKYPYAVHVVLYGHIDAQLLSRIKGIVSRKPERTFLTYLPDAKRIRKRNSA